MVGVLDRTDRGLGLHLPFAERSLLGIHHLNRKVDIRLPGKENSNSHGARPVHQKTSVDPDQ